MTDINLSNYKKVIILIGRPIRPSYSYLVWTITIVPVLLFEDTFETGWDGAIELIEPDFDNPDFSIEDTFETGWDGV